MCKFGSSGKTPPVLPLFVMAEKLLFITNRLLEIVKKILFYWKSGEVPKSKHKAISAASNYPFNFTIETRVLISTQ